MELKTCEVVYARNGENKKPGVVTGQRRCQMIGCPGVRLSVRWINGKRTFPCTKGMKVVFESGDTRAWRIL